MLLLYGPQSLRKFFPLAVFEYSCRPPTSLANVEKVEAEFGQRPFNCCHHRLLLEICQSKVVGLFLKAAFRFYLFIVSFFILLMETLASHLYKHTSTCWLVIKWSCRFKKKFKFKTLKIFNFSETLYPDLHKLKTWVTILKSQDALRTVPSRRLVRDGKIFPLNLNSGGGPRLFSWSSFVLFNDCFVQIQVLTYYPFDLPD